MFYSVGTGIATVTLIHSHRVVPLLGVNLLWFTYLALIHGRACATEGKLLNVPAGFFYGVAVACYLLGLLLSSVYFTVYGAN
jgi:hypothetical protein